MKVHPKQFNIIVIFALLLGLFAAVPPAYAVGNTITVTTTALTNSIDGACSLTEALQAAWLNSAFNDCTAGSGSDVDWIKFNIPVSDPGYSAGIYSIAVAGTLNVSTDVILDGTSQPGYAGSPVIRFVGDGVAANVIQFNDGSDYSIFKGFMLTNAYWTALSIYTGADHITLKANYFNTDGTALLGASDYPTAVKIFRANYITVGGPADNNRNLFAGNIGVQIDGGSNNTVENNYFGVQADGITPLSGLVPNSATVLIETNTLVPTANTIRNNVMTGFESGIQLGSQVNNTLIVGNKIGVAADGSTELGMSSGITLYGASFNTIGGTTAADRNIMSGNTYAQIRIYNSGPDHSDSNLILGNYIGTDADGETGIPAASGNGIMLEGGSGNQVGGANPGEGNLISGFSGGAAVQVYSTSGSVSNTSILGNKIGTDKDGESAIPNYTGIMVSYTAVDIGDGTTAGSNLIAGNTEYGIFVSGTGTAGTNIQRNRFGISTSGLSNLSNSGSAINLNTDASAQITGNWIANSGLYSLAVAGTALVEPGSSGNCFTNNGTHGVQNFNAAVAPLESNWWGDPSGPTEPNGNPTGTGDKITTSSANVDYTPFLTSRPALCSPTLTPDNLSPDFGDKIIGFSAPMILTLSNTGQAALSLTSLSIDAPFSIDPASTCTAGGQVAAGGSCVLKLLFTPSVVGPASGNLTILSDAASSPDILPLAGSGITGTQLLINNSFETDADLNQRPDSWSISNFVPATDGRDCTIHKSGSCSLKLTGDDKKKVVKQVILKSGVTGDNFAFSLWSRSSNIPAGSIYRLQVQFFDGAALISTKNMSFAAGTHSFQQVSGNFTAPSNYTKVVFKIVLKAASGRAWFDKASLKWAP